MYDKVKFWVDRGYIREQYNAVVNSLENAKIIDESKANKGVKIYGNLGNLKIGAFENGLFVAGSLPKYLYGNNVCTLNRHTAKNAIEKIEDDLHFSLEDALITEIEFGSTFVMQNKVEDYLVRLGNVPRLGKHQVNPSSLYYQGQGGRPPKTLAFYDKGVEMDARGVDNPIDANLLRYEMRYRGRLAKQFKTSKITASTLSEESFYRDMVSLYQDNYFKIPKQGQMINAMKDIKTVSDAYNLLVSQMISQLGADQIDAYLAELKQAGVFEDRKNYSRLKSKIAKVATSSNEDDCLIRELDDEIKNCGAYV